MKSKHGSNVSDAARRRMAEEVLRKDPDSKPVFITADMQKLVHELQVHQTELEMQNDELRAAHMELALSRDQYAELYDFAPVGYITLNAETTIVEANGGAIVMLGLNRASINTGRLKFSRYVSRESQDDWFRFSRTMFAGEEKQRCELALRGGDKTTLTVLLESVAVRNTSGDLDRCMIALIDVTERKKMEAELEMYRQNLEALVEQRTGELTVVNAQIEAELAERTRMEQEIEVLARFPSENPNPVLRISKTGVVLYANEASRPLLKMWECKSGEVIPEPWRKIAAETFADQAQRVEDIECGRRTFSFSLVPVFDAGYVNFYGRDITERKRAEEKLGESQRQNEFLADIIETSSQPFTVGYPDGKMGLSNKAFEGLTDYTAKELQSIDWAKKLTPPQFLDMEMKELDKLHKTGKPVRYEKEYIRKDGSRVPVELLVHLANDTDGKPQYYYSFVTDISERKRARENLAFQSHLLENVHDAAIGLDADFFINYWNESAERMYGWTAQEAIGRKSYELFQTVAASGTLEEMTARIRIAGRSSFEVIHRTKDGRELFVEVSSSAIFDQDGKPTEFISICRDMTDHKKAEEILAFQARLLSEVHDAVFSSDSNFSITYWNQAAESMLGWTREEVLGKNSGELLKPEVENSSRDHERSKLRSAGHWDGEVRYIRKDGTRLLVEVNSTVLRDVNGKDVGNVVVARDITKRKAAEQALRESEDRYRNLVMQAPAGIYYVEFPSGRFTEVNDVMCRILGYTRDELLAATAPQILDDEGRARFASRVRKAQAGDKPDEAVEYHVRKKDGSFIWGLLNTTFRWDGGKIVGAMVVAHDITIRKQAEDALRESEVRLSRAQEIAHLGSWELDLGNNRLTWSDEVYRIFGLKPQEFDATYEAFLDAVHPEDRAAVDVAYSGSLKEGRDTYQIEHRVVRKSTGEIRTVQEKCDHVRDGSGRIIRSVGMVHDVTERKQMEEKLRATLLRFYLILSSMNFGILLVTDDNKVEFANQAFCDDFGLKDSTDDLLKLSASEMIDKIKFSYKNPEEAVARIKEIVSLGQPVSSEDVGMGSDRAFLRDFIPIRIGEKKYGRLWVHMDITERKKAEEKILKTTEELRKTNEDLARFNRVMVDRELRMIEMKKEVNDLCRELGKPVRYELVYVNEQ